MYGTSVKSNIGYTYEIDSLLGDGGCGCVYKAWHKRLQKYLVLKELKDSSQKTTEVRRNEIEALKNVKNMYIPQVFDYISDDDKSFTVMEYIEGKSLDISLAEGVIFPVPTVVKWYYQLSNALDTLHRNDVCHRDIKPSNIIQTTSGDVCLIDYNSALVTGNNTRIVNRSMGYASPEQYSYFQMCDNAYRNRSIHSVKQRTKSIDWKLSDIYSLGATMYHILTGRRPQAYTVYAEHVSLVGDCSAIEKRSPLQANVWGIIERSMRFNPEDRYTSAGELCGELLKLYRGV